MNKLFARVGMYGSLIKGLQTGLLLVTGLAGYASARCPTQGWEMLFAVTASLFLAISGSTVLNMVWDRDIDAKMKRACQRPLPSKRLSALEGLILGLVMSIIGIVWSIVLSPLYGAIVFAGWFCHVVIYTMWLKRRTAWSILWGGIAGAMPVLAGRALGTGEIDLIGMLLAVSILLWIPTHMLTFGMKYADQYRTVDVPVVPNTHAEWVTRIMLSSSTALAAVAMLVAAWTIRLPWGYLHIAAGLSAVMLGITMTSVIRHSTRLNSALYKFASLYMLGSMGLILAGVAVH